MATGGDPVYTPETSNGARLQALLIDEGTRLVRKVFDNKVSKMNPPSLRDQLLQQKSHLEVYLDPSQRKKVYPGGTTVVDSSKDFDLSLLSLLLGRLCHMRPPTTGWGRPPPVGDKSPIAWIIRLRLFRNENYGHITNTALSNTKFKKLWKELSDILRGLGGDQNRILKRKTQTIDPEQAKMYREKFERLQRQDNEVKDLIVAQGAQAAAQLSSLADDVQRQTSEIKKTEKELQHIERTHGKQHKQEMDKLAELEEGQKDILAGQQDIITAVEKHYTSPDKGHQDDKLKTTIEGSPTNGEQRQVEGRVSMLSLGVDQTELGNVLAQPQSGSETNNSEADGQNNIQKHDFSVLCSKNDKSWTETNIVHKLEEQQLKGYFPPRDDIAGDSVFQYLSDGIANSRNVIIVFSSSTKLDEWFRKGYQIAVVEKLDRKLIAKVIPVLHDGFTRTDLPIALRDTTPLDAEDTNFFDELQKSLSVRQ
ncbi:uncharacterized protein LOC144883817 [Branchiostoma floridae x Branchiostoma japonicum]